MASVLFVLVATLLVVSADASRYGHQLQERQLSYLSSSSSCNQQKDTDRCAGAQGELTQVRNKCCNEMGKCGKFICPTVKGVADSIPFLQGLCGDEYDACSPWKWNDQTGEECKAEECKAAVEALKEKHMNCFRCHTHLKRN